MNANRTEVEAAAILLWSSSPDEEAIADALMVVLPIVDQWIEDHNPPPTCRRGHPFSGSNLIVDNLGRRVCRECSNANRRRSYAKARGVVGT